jgi:predicted nucleic acid-binding protein
MILLDSNIIIYLRDPAFSEHIANRLPDERLHTCNVIIAEVLGHSGLEKTDSRYFENFFAAMKTHDFDEKVLKQVIYLRKTQNVELPDAIVAATALTNDLTLWTHDTRDFKKITGIQLFDPLQNRTR